MGSANFLKPPPAKLYNIFIKKMEKSRLRQQKMLLSLQRYEFGLEYKPVKE